VVDYLQLWWLYSIGLCGTMSNDTDIADLILDQRTKASTKGQYARKLKHFVQWVSDHHPEHIADDGVNYLEMTGRQYVNFFASVEKTRGEGEEGAGYLGYNLKRGFNKGLIN